MLEKRNRHDYKGSKFITHEALEERLKNSDLSEEEKKLSREIIKQAKLHNIGLAEDEINVGKRNFLKGMGILGGALLVMGKIPKVFADTMIEKFNLDLGSKETQQRLEELEYWSQIWKSNYVNEFGVQIGLEFKKEDITKDSSEMAITQAVRNAAVTMENLLNAFTCWGQNTPWQTTRGVCGAGGFCQTFAQLHAPAGQYFCSPNTRMVGWDIRVLNAEFLPTGDLKLKMNVLIVDKKYFHTSERVDAPWILEKFATPEYITDLHLSKVLENGKPWPNPKYYTFQSGPNKDKEFKDGEPFEAADFMGERVPPYTKLDKATWVKDLTLKVLRGGGGDSGKLTIDPWASYPFEQLHDTTGLALLKKISQMEDEGWRKYQPTKGDWKSYGTELRETLKELREHINALGNSYYKYIEPSFYHLVWFTYGVKNYGGEVTLNIRVGSGCKPRDSPIPGANCETGCLLPRALTPFTPSCTQGQTITNNKWGYNLHGISVNCNGDSIKVGIKIYLNNNPAPNEKFDYKYYSNILHQGGGSFTTNKLGYFELTIPASDIITPKFWLYLYSLNENGSKSSSPFSSTDHSDPCVPSVGKSSGTATPTISNLQWGTNNFCTKKGFTVSGRLTQDGAGTRGIVNVAVNNNKVACTLVDSNNYNFSITVPLSEYKKYLAKTGENTISATGILCATGDCSGSCLGPITNPQSVTIPDCACDYTLNISNYSVTPNTVTIGNSVVVSGSIDLTKGQNCFLNGQDIDIYNNGSKVATAVTDAKGNFSTSVTLKTAGIHKIEAKLGNSTVSKDVTVTETWNVEVKYVTTTKDLVIGESSFSVKITPPQNNIISWTTSNDILYGDIFDNNIKLDIPSLSLPPCNVYNDSCATVKLSGTTHNKIKASLQALKNPTLEDAIMVKVNEAAVEVFRKYVTNEYLNVKYGECYNKGEAPSCSSTAEYIDNDTKLGPLIIKHDRIWRKSITFTET